MSIATTQRVTALERANVVRFEGAQLKRDIRDGKLSIAMALRDARAQPLRIGAVLVQQPQWGEGRVRRYLGSLYISPHRRVRDLTERQVRMLSEGLG